MIGETNSSSVIPVDYPISSVIPVNYPISSSVIPVDYPIPSHSIVIFSNFEAFNIFFFISVFNKY